MRFLVLSMTAVLATGCAAPVETAQREEVRERCDTVVTGSNIPRCDPGATKVITREELERDGYPVTRQRGAWTSPGSQ